MAKERSAAILAMADSAKSWLIVLLPFYLAIRVFAFAGANPSLTLEVVRQQGISGIAEAAITSIFTELGGLVLVSGLLLSFVTFFGERPVDESSLLAASWNAIQIAAPIAVVAGAFIAPLTFVGFAVILGVLLLRAPGRSWVALGGVLFATVVLGTPILNAAWLPYERIGGPKQASEGEGGAPFSFLYGYVIGESGGFTSVLEDSPRRAHLVREVTSREICKPPTRWYRFEAPSIVNLGWGGRVAQCSDLPVNPTEPWEPTPAPIKTQGPTNRTTTTSSPTPSPSGTSPSPTATRPSPSSSSPTPHVTVTFNSTPLGPDIIQEG